ncbi:MAG: Rrf2 family transcriptional regulator [Chloroflexi bacterium]|nr:Rrf2 family transcriptional regulator [Chloroflexota bacterium]
MQITRQADYAVRAVLYLAEQEANGRAPTSRIAQEMRIPPSFLAKIVSQLSVAGVVQTSRGARGGVSLAREPKDITLLEVIEAIDGPITLNECVPDRSACVFGADCPVHDIWCDTQAKLVEQLGKSNFGALPHRTARPS